MLDDTSVDWHDLYHEFIDTAFGKAAPAMTTFYDLQDKQMALMSDYFGVEGPLLQLGRNRVNGGYNAWYFLSVYTPEYVSAANDALSQAERNADSSDVKARLHLIRIRFDYLSGLAKILTLQNAWTVAPSDASLDALVDALDAWHTPIRMLAGGTGQSTFKPLSDWPTMLPFQDAGSSYNAASLMITTYQQAWYLTSLAWDTEAIHAGILTKPHEAKVSSTSTEPTIDSKEWDNAPSMKFLRESDGMPVTNTPTTFQVLRDNNNLYVRMDIENPNVYVPDINVPKSENDVLKRHNVDLAIQPVTDGPIYHLAANPVQDARYDAVIKGSGKEDITWNGTWSFTYEIGEKTSKNYTATYTGNWIALFKIPFSTLGVNSPAAGAAWGFNASRQDPAMIWSNGSSVVAPQSLGKLIF
jgi:hypothetical protein